MLRAVGCILLVIAAAAPVFGQPPPIPISPRPGPQGKSDRTVLIFLPQRLFSSEEFEPTLRELSLAGLQTRIASSDTGVAVSMGQIVLKPDLALPDVQVTDYAGLVLIGGSGAAMTWGDSLLQTRCRQFAESDRVVAAIGIAPITLARAGVLKGRKATVFHERSAIGWLKESGAKFSFRELVADRNIITAADDKQAHAFGRAVAAAVLAAK
ncbi:MAG: DJ-1/PfpI family protein [candidate division WOR-3 bacterium]|nr:DJ-1/PfpI family protein [candidate division WOR-3 bacterium]